MNFIKIANHIINVAHIIRISKEEPNIVFYLENVQVLKFTREEYRKSILWSNELDRDEHASFIHFTEPKAGKRKE